jgi:hypothetical protein
VLEVVQNQKQLTRADRSQQELPSARTAGFLHIQRPSDRRWHELRIAHGSEFDEHSPIAVHVQQFRRHGQSQTSLTHLARTDKRHASRLPSHRIQQLAQVGQLRLASDQWCRWSRQPHEPL